MGRWNSLVVVLTCALSAGCGGGGEIELQPDPSQADTYNQLRDMESVVTLDDTGMITSVEFDKPEHGDSALAILSDIPTLKAVGLSGSGVTDAGMSEIQKLTSLEKLSLEDTKVSVAAFRRLQEALPDCQITYRDGDSD